MPDGIFLGRMLQGKGMRWKRKDGRGKMEEERWKRKDGRGKMVPCGPGSRWRRAGPLAGSGFGKCQQEAGSPQGAEFQFQVPPQGACRILGQRQPQAYAGLAAVGGVLRAPEGLEHQLAVFRGDARAVVPEADDDVVAVRLDGELDFRVFPLGVFNGVGGQVVHDLLHGDGIRMNG